MDPRWALKCWAISPHGLRKNTQQVSLRSYYHVVDANTTKRENATKMSVLHVGRHPIMFQESVNGIHLGPLELYNPLNNTGQDHPCNSQSGFF